MVYDKCVKDANGYGFPDDRRRYRDGRTVAAWPGRQVATVTAIQYRGGARAGAAHVVTVSRSRVTVAAI